MLDAHFPGLPFRWTQGEKGERERKNTTCSTQPKARARSSSDCHNQPTKTQRTYSLHQPKTSYHPRESPVSLLRILATCAAYGHRLPMKFAKIFCEKREKKLVWLLSLLRTNSTGGKSAGRPSTIANYRRSNVSVYQRLSSAFDGCTAVDVTNDLDRARIASDASTANSSSQRTKSSCVLGSKRRVCPLLCTPPLEHRAEALGATTSGLNQRHVKREEAARVIR